MKIRIVSQSRITLLGISISHPNAHLKINFLFPRWHMLVPWRVPLVQPFVNFFSHGEIPHGNPRRKIRGPRYFEQTPDAGEPILRELFDKPSKKKRGLQKDTFLLF